jgi:hypothetical protein
MLLISYIFWVLQKAGKWLPHSLFALLPYSATIFYQTHYASSISKAVFSLKGLIMKEATIVLSSSN